MVLVRPQRIGATDGEEEERGWEHVLVVRFLVRFLVGRVYSVGASIQLAIWGARVSS